MVCHLISENIYLQLTFTNWSPGSNGAFAYTRTTMASPLPIHLLSFKAIWKSNGQIALDWQTTFEENNKGFEVERSTNGIEFETLDFIPAVDVLGAENRYSFNDRFVPYGKVYYRLKQLDHDGNFKYSEVINVTGESTKQIYLFPIPAKDLIHIQFPYDVENIGINIYNLAGQKVYKEMFTGNQYGRELSISIEDLVQGVYNMEILGQKGRTALLFIK